MSQLALKYKNTDGEERSVFIETDRYTIGRHSTNDLTITDGRLSREHVVVERSDDGFKIRDLGSSNGSFLNGERIDESVIIADGDVLSLGGLEFVCVIERPVEGEGSPIGNPEDHVAELGPPPDVATPPHVQPPVAGPPAIEGGIPTSIFYIAPLFAVVILIVLGAFIFLSSGKSNGRSESDPVISSDINDLPLSKPPPTGSDDGPTTSPNIDSTPSASSNGMTPSPAAQTLTVKVESNAATFLRKAAQNDQRAFITGEQAKIVEARVRSFSGSSAVAENINSVRRNASEFRALATAKNLKPHLLAAAALAKLGTGRGDVVAAARSMVEILDKLGTQIGSELGEDCLLMIAAYDQGAAGDYLKMRNMLQDLAKKLPDSSRDIRTIWFLKKNDKITDSQFDLAVRFLAMGTIAQNPKDFDVNAEGIDF